MATRNGVQIETDLTVATGVLPVSKGGTGLASVGAAGALPYFATTTTISSIAAVPVGQLFCSAGTGTVPAWSSAPALTAASPSFTLNSSDANGGALLNFDNNSIQNMYVRIYGSTHGQTFLGVTTNGLAAIQADGVGSALAIGTTSGGGLLHLGSNDIARAKLGTDAEAASVTALYLSVNGVMKRVTVSASTLACDAGNHILQIAD